MEKQPKRVSIEEAVIMALLMHSRQHFNLWEAVSTALHLRRQYNFLYDHGISREMFQNLLNEIQQGDVTSCWE